MNNCALREWKKDYTWNHKDGPPAAQSEFIDLEGGIFLRGVLKRVGKGFKKDKWNYLFLAPAALYTFIFGYATLPYIIIAFEKFDFKKGIASPFVGLKNFEFFFSSSRAWEVTRNTVLMNLYYIIFGTIVAVALALLINEIKCKWFLKVSQATLLFPYFISWVIVSYILYSLLSTDYGIFNSVLGAFGIEPVSWYSRPEYWRGIIVFARIWKTAGYSSIIYLAVITGIDSGILEAAAIDGAKRIQIIRRIIIPTLLPTICILLLMEIGKIFYGDFGMIYALVKDSGQLLPKVDVIDTYVFRMLRVTGDPSLSMAVGLYQSLVGFVLVFVSNFIVKKKYPDGTLF